MSAANPLLSELMAAIKVAINADLGVYDLSATGAVLRGTYDLPPGGRLPFACIATPAITSRQGPPMGSYERRASVDVIAWAAGTTDDLDSRTIATEAFASELMAAIENAVGTPGNALYDTHEFVVETTLLPGAADVLQTDPLIVVLTLSFAWTRDVGVG